MGWLPDVILDSWLDQHTFSSNNCGECAAQVVSNTKWLDILVLDGKCLGLDISQHLSDLTLLLDLREPLRREQSVAVTTHRFYLSWVVGIGGEGRLPCMWSMSPICAPPHWVQCTQYSWHSQIAFWFIPLLMLSVICLFKGSWTRCLEAYVYLSA